MKKEISLLDGEYELLKNELVENKIYIEIAAVTLFFVLALFLGTEQGIKELSNRSLLGYGIAFTAFLLLVGIIYLFIEILITTNKKMENIKNTKKSMIRNWLE